MSAFMSFHFQTAADVGRLSLTVAGIEGGVEASFQSPFDTAGRMALAAVLEPGVNVHQMPEILRQKLDKLNMLTKKKSLRRKFREQIGVALWEALTADAGIQTLYHTARGAFGDGTMPVEFRFDLGSQDLASLPWELLHANGRFLVRDGVIAPSRSLDAPLARPELLAELPLRVLLVVSRPLDLAQLDPAAERQALVGGLRALDEEGAVMVDLLRPPTFQTLLRAISSGDYHVLHFDGHGAFGRICEECEALNAPGATQCQRPDCGEPLPPPEGTLAFENPYGGWDSIQAGVWAAALKRSRGQLGLLSACQSAQTPAQRPADGEQDLSSGAWSSAPLPCSRPACRWP